MSAGTSSRQRGVASGQRVWNRQAFGGLVGEGTSPPRIWRCLLRARRGSGTGTALSSAPVYGWRGWA